MKFVWPVLLLFMSCSHYQLTRNKNPFKKYGVKSIAVPMFYNQTNLANISHHFTYEFTKLMYDMRELEVKSASSNTADAYLVGILRNANKRRDALNRGLSRTSSDRFPVNAGEQELLVPVTTNLRMVLDIFLVRRSPKTMGFIYDLRKKNFPHLVKGHPAIIFKESLPIRGGFARETLDQGASVVNSTQNRGILQKVLEREALETARHFREKILYAF